MYYVDSSYCRNTFLDMSIEKGIGINNSSFIEMATEYLENKTEFKVTISKMSDIYFEINKTEDYSEIKIGNSILSKDNTMVRKQIAFTRSFNGKIIVFYIIGFVSFLVNDNFQYNNFICLQIPSESTSSCVETTLNGFLKTKEFWTTLNSDNPPIFLLSDKRLHINSLKYCSQNNKCFFITNKLVVRQYRIIDKQELFEKLKEKQQSTDV